MIARIFTSTGKDLMRNSPKILGMLNCSRLESESLYKATVAPVNTKLWVESRTMPFTPPNLAESFIGVCAYIFKLNKIDSRNKIALKPPLKTVIVEDKFMNLVGSIWDNCVKQMYCKKEETD